jgi:phage terminase large subunit GpA-like protein
MLPTFDVSAVRRIGKSEELMCHGIGYAIETNLRETLCLVLSAAREYKHRKHNVSLVPTIRWAPTD